MLGTAVLAVLLNVVILQNPVEIAYVGESSHVRDLLDLVEECSERFATFRTFLQDVQDWRDESGGNENPLFLVGVGRSLVNSHAAPEEFKFLYATAPPQAFSKSTRIIQIMVRGSTFGYRLDLDDIEKYPAMEKQPSGAFRFSDPATPRYAICRCEVLIHEFAELLNIYQSGRDYANRNHPAGLSKENELRSEAGLRGDRGQDRAHRGLESWREVDVGSERVYQRIEGGNIVEITYVPPVVNHQ